MAFTFCEDILTCFFISKGCFNSSLMTVKSLGFLQSFNEPTDRALLSWFSRWTRLTNIYSTFK